MRSSSSARRDIVSAVLAPGPPFRWAAGRCQGVECTRAAQEGGLARGFRGRTLAGRRCIAGSQMGSRRVFPVSVSSRTGDLNLDPAWSLRSWRRIRLACDGVGYAPLRLSAHREAGEAGHVGLRARRWEQ